MANKKDLTEAQSYSRARLVTAFNSGLPDGKELVPKKGLLPVAIGVGLTAIAVLVSVFYGILNPGLPADWSNNKLIVAKGTASRFVSVNGTLHPVINTTSARLLIPAADYEVIIVNDAELEGIPVGGSIGIVGAPDILPNRSRLVSKHMASCLDDGDGTPGGSIRNIITNDPVVSAASERQATVVTAASHTYVIANGTSHQLPDDELTRASILRLLGLGQATALQAPEQWLDVFATGSPIAPVEVDDAGSAIDVEGESYTVGSLVTLDGDDDTQYVVMGDATLAPLTGLTLDMYKLGKSDEVTRPQPLSVQAMSGFGGTDATFIPRDWPTAKLTALDSGTTVCASTANKTATSLATMRDDSALTHATSHTTISNGSGALFRAVSGSDGTQGMLYVVDGSGIAYAVADDTTDILARLGYQDSDISTVPRAWANVFTMGVTLSSNEAGMSIESQITDPQS
jgi:type VII secretion protein EccB